MLSACGSTPPGARTVAPGGHGVLRAVYRDGTRRLLVVLPGPGRALPRGDCVAPLLIDEASGAVRQVTPGEASDLMHHMQLSGAIEGTCP